MQDDTLYYVSWQTFGRFSYVVNTKMLINKVRDQFEKLQTVLCSAINGLVHGACWLKSTIASQWYRIL